nr:PREDICTED: uncharacterized protein LOC109039085 [Bemisia tabaci]
MGSSRPRRSRGFRVTSANPAPVAGVNYYWAAMLNVINEDPCWALRDQPADDHAANQNCGRAATWYARRDENERVNCKFPTDPKCRLYGRFFRCTVKIQRSPLNPWCLLGHSQRVVLLTYCTAPLHAANVPNAPHAMPQGFAAAAGGQFHVG